MRFSRDGAPGLPVVEFVSKGCGAIDATNEIQLSQVNIYGAEGPSFVIRNDGEGVVRDITTDQLRIEGKKNGTTAADLLVIGDPVMRGNVNNISFTSLELLDPYKGFAALRIAAPPGQPAPYQITVSGEIGGGLSKGECLRIDAGRTLTFKMTGIHTMGTNVVIGRGVRQIVLDGGGQERHWTYRIDPISLPGISVPNGMRAIRRSPEPPFQSVSMRPLSVRAVHPHWSGSIRLSPSDSTLVLEGHGSTGRYDELDGIITVSWDRFPAETFVDANGVWVHRSLIENAPRLDNVCVFSSGDALFRASEVTLRLGSGYEVALRASTSDMPTFEQVFGREEYASPDLPPDTRTIIDLGANLGLSAVFFGLRYPSAQILALEPSQGNYRQMLKNVTGMRGRVRPVLAAA